MDKWPKTRIATIAELAQVFAGYSPRPEERKQKGNYLLIGGRNIKDEHLILTEKDTYIDGTPKTSFRNAIARPGDIIVSILFDRRKFCIYSSEDPQAVINNSCAIIRAPNNNDYIVSYMRTLGGRDQFLTDAKDVTSGAFIPRLSIKDLHKIQIPILPLSDLQRLGDNYIKSSSTDDLVILRNELQSKNMQIEELRGQLQTISDKDQEIDRLNIELTEVIKYWEDRLQKVEAQISTNDLKSRIAHGETKTFEFKSSLRWNLKSNADDTKIEVAVLKTIAAFCNTEGGELVIGVSDDKTILGIEHDHFSNGDKFLLHLRNLITDKLIPSVIKYVDYELVTLSEKIVCYVICQKSPIDIWVKASKNDPEIFYVRTGPSTEELSPREATRYIREHFKSG